MRSDNYHGEYQPEMKSTSHQQFDNRSLSGQQVKYKSKHLTDYDIVTNTGRKQEHIMNENAFERYYPDKKVSRISSNKTGPH